MIVAFDFDKTLDNSRIQSLCKKIIKEKNEVWCITMRKDNEFNNKILNTVLDKINLSKSNVIFCNGKPKYEMIKMVNADIYIDNIKDEFDTITNYTNTIPLLWLDQ